jgi:hypothetical protein
VLERLLLFAGLSGWDVVPVAARPTARRRALLLVVLVGLLLRLPRRDVGLIRARRFRRRLSRRRRSLRRGGRRCGGRRRRGRRELWAGAVSTVSTASARRRARAIAAGRPLACRMRRSMSAHRCRTCGSRHRRSGRGRRDRAVGWPLDWALARRRRRHDDFLLRSRDGLRTGSGTEPNPDRMDRRDVRSSGIENQGKRDCGEHKRYRRRYDQTSDRPDCAALATFIGPQRTLPPFRIALPRPQSRDTRILAGRQPPPECAVRCFRANRAIRGPCARHTEARHWFP